MHFLEVTFHCADEFLDSTGSLANLTIGFRLQS